MKFGSFASLVATVVLVLCASCAPKPIEIGYEHALLDSGNALPSVEVNVIGFSNDANLNQFRNCSLNDYFDMSKTISLRTDLLDAGVVKVLHFDAQTKGQPTVDSADSVLVIAPDDPIYKAWIAKGVTTIVVVQDYPRPADVTANPPAAQDSRFRQVPFASGQWKGNALIIRIQRSGPYVVNSVE